MRAIIVVLVLTLAVTSCFAQGKPKYQVGTIVDVKDHQPTSTANDGSKQFDVSVRVNNTIYVVLLTSPDGSETVKFRIGVDGPVLIEGDTMKFSDIMGTTRSVPILSRKPAPKQGS